MESINRNLSTHKPSCQFFREKNVCKFWLRVTIYFTVRLFTVQIVFFDSTETMSEAWHVDNTARLGFLSTKKANCLQRNLLNFFSPLLSYAVERDYLRIDVKWIPWALAIEDLSTKNVQNDWPQFEAPNRLWFVLTELPEKKVFIASKIRNYKRN